MCDHHAAEEETTMFKMARKMFSAEERAQFDVDYEEWEISRGGKCSGRGKTQGRGKRQSKIPVGLTTIVGRVSTRGFRLIAGPARLAPAAQESDSNGLIHPAILALDSDPDRMKTSPAGIIDAG